MRFNKAKIYLTIVTCIAVIVPHYVYAQQQTYQGTIGKTYLESKEWWPHRQHRQKMHQMLYGY